GSHANDSIACYRLPDHVLRDGVGGGELRAADAGRAIDEHGFRMDIATDRRSRGIGGGGGDAAGCGAAWVVSTADRADASPARRLTPDECALGAGGGTGRGGGDLDVSLRCARCGAGEFEGLSNFFARVET